MSIDVENSTEMTVSKTDLGNIRNFTNNYLNADQHGDMVLVARGAEASRALIQIMTRMTRERGDLDFQVSFRTKDITIKDRESGKDIPIKGVTMYAKRVVEVI